MNRLLRSTLALAAAFAATIASAQGLTACQCGNLREMRDRWCSARAARAEYERIVRFLETESRTTGKARLYSLADKKMINQECVLEAINSVSDRGEVKGAAITIENHPAESILKEDCRIKVTLEGSACLKQIVESHEALHAAACQQRLRLRRGSPLSTMWEQGLPQSWFQNFTGDTKYMMTSRQFALEESASYLKEMQLIADKWKSLQATCSSASFEVALGTNNEVGDSLWNRNVTRDASGKETHVYKMYDLTADPCPSRPRRSPSQCTMK